MLRRAADYDFSIAYKMEYTMTTDHKGKTQQSPPRAPNQAQRALLALALFYTLYFAKTFLIPVVMSLLFALLLLPAVNLLKRLRVPRGISACLLLALAIVPLTLLSTRLVAPLQEWATKLPEVMETVQDRMAPLSRVMQGDEAAAGPETDEGEAAADRGGEFFDFLRDEAVEQVEAASGEGAAASAMTSQLQRGGVALATEALASAPELFAQWIIFIVLLTFMLIFGPPLFATLVDEFPMFQDKQRASQLVSLIETELSHYVLVVSAINAGLGVVTALGLWLAGVNDPLIWGAIVALLNFAPYVGPIIGIAMLLLASLMEHGATAAALAPPLVYFSINFVEAQFVTPTVLGNRMRLNPLIVAAWLLFCGWLWGFVGVLIAVPLLVCIKLTAQQLGRFEHWTRVIESGG